MMRLKSNIQAPHSFVVGSAFILLLLCYHFIFSFYFPNFQGKLGHDFSFVLPMLLDGYFWHKSNSLFDTPWFTPSFCGGQPYFADVQSNYYSLGQFFTVFFDPLTSVYICVLVFASLGFWGMYLLLRQLFKTSTEAAFLGASLFMFNGFYIYRMMVGHFGFHGFMLVPWIALLLCVAPAGQEKEKLPAMVNATLAGILVAYWLQSGFTILVIPAALAVLAIACLHYLNSQDGWRIFLGRAAGAILIASALSAAKVMGVFAFIASFPRSHYLLPGFDGLFSALKVLFITLFFPSTEIEKTAFANLIDMQWVLSRHEWEFGVTFIPLLIILLAWTMWLWRQLHSPLPIFNKYTAKSWFSLSLLIIILILPLILNIYTPAWNAMLKRTPLIKSSSSLIRWWLIYVPIVIVYAAIALEKLAFLAKYRVSAIACSVIAILLLNLMQNRLYYDLQNYNPDAILEAYRQSTIHDIQPRIQEVGLSESGNDAIVSGISQLACYNASFGYQLENLPIKSLHPGSIFEQSNGDLNLKNPACYVFPTENHCQPGDHFSVEQKAQAVLFANYKPFAFAIPLKQKIANFISFISLISSLVFLAYVVCCFTIRRFFINQYLASKN